MQRPALAVLAATAWISVHEFVRNQVVLAHAWEAHYHGLGLTFPASPMNGAVWGLWALLQASAMLVIARRFSLGWTAGLGWSMGFLQMWTVIGNLGVLPFGILGIAVPWSLVEAFGAGWIVKRLG